MDDDRIAPDPDHGPLAHAFVRAPEFEQLRLELRPITSPEGATVEGLYDAWIWLDNPSQYNSYTTTMLREICVALDWTSCRHDVNVVVLTAVGEKAFCTGGNTVEYQREYSHRPHAYRTYMGLFNRMISLMLENEHPVINRVNGMRIGGGQEMGLACDFSVAHDMARFGQAGPKHGSAPDGGSTDFLDLYLGFAKGMESAVLCEHWSAHLSHERGMINRLVPSLRTPDGTWIPNPLIHYDGRDPETGLPLYGHPLTGEALAAAKALVATCTTDLSRLDAAVNEISWTLLHTFPAATRKSITSVRKKKLAWWDMNRETNREWLALNMSGDAAAGFRAFNEGGQRRADGSRTPREIDFIALRQAIARNEPWTQELIDRIQPLGTDD